MKKYLLLTLLFFSSLSFATTIHVSGIENVPNATTVDSDKEEDSYIELRFQNYPETCHVILNNKSIVNISINDKGNCAY